MWFMVPKHPSNVQSFLSKYGATALVRSGRSRAHRYAARSWDGVPCLYLQLSQTHLEVAESAPALFYQRVLLTNELKRPCKRAGE